LAQLIEQARVLDRDDGLTGEVCDQLDLFLGRVEDGRGRLGRAATLRFPSPLIEPDVPISGIRLSDWLSP
jgi:hypothetical protein